MFITRISPYWMFRPIATRAYMPPVMTPATARSSQRLRLLPRRLREHDRCGGTVLRPHHLELALLPLADDAGGGDVLAILEADLADDGVELVAGDVLAQRLAIEADR